MKKTCKVYHDGYHYIANLTQPIRLKEPARGTRFQNPIFDKFKEFYAEAREKKISKRGMYEYITERYIDTHEDIINDIPTVDELEDMNKRWQNNLHKRKVRFFRKAFLHEWNWFTTFTYDSDKINEDDFTKQIRTKLSDLSSHKGWDYMMVWERGKKNERKHLHAFLHVPEGTMPGFLFTDRHYSTSRHKWEFFTNNSYFAERFGTTEWKALGDMKNHKSLLNYMLKYIFKTEERIIYSRGIPGEIEIDIDIDQDISGYYQKGGVMKGLVDITFFMKDEEKTKAFEGCFNIELSFDEEIAVTNELIQKGMYMNNGKIIVDILDPDSGIFKSFDRATGEVTF